MGRGIRTLADLILSRRYSRFLFSSKPTQRVAGTISRPSRPSVGSRFPCRRIGRTRPSASAAVTAVSVRFFFFCPVPRTDSTLRRPGKSCAVERSDKRKTTQSRNRADRAFARLVYANDAPSSSLLPRERARVPQHGYKYNDDVGLVAAAIIIIITIIIRAVLRCYVPSS